LCPDFYSSEIEKSFEKNSENKKLTTIEIFVFCSNFDSRFSIVPPFFVLQKMAEE